MEVKAIMFRFDFKKTIQAISVTIRENPNHVIGRLRLLKLLYIADREAIRETGYPITCDRVVAMKHGPVLSCLYDIIKGENSKSPEFNNYYTVNGRDISMHNDPGIGSLNKYEIRKLKEVVEKYKTVEDYDIVKETHLFPEWSKNDPGNSSIAISWNDIFESLELDEEKIASIKREVQLRNSMIATLID